MKKIVLSILLVLALFCGSLAASAVTEEEIKANTSVYDADFDNSISLKDALLLLRAVVNGEGFNLTDVLRTMKMTVNPSFSQCVYSYDKSGEQDMTFDLDLHGAELYYLEIDGELAPEDAFSYSQSDKVLTVNNEYFVNLDLGAHKILVIADAKVNVAPECTLVVKNSVTTSFDSVTTKHFEFGTDTEVSFDVDFATANVREVRRGDQVLSAESYSYDGNMLTIFEDALLYSKSAQFSVILTNNEKYDFTVTNNRLFYTDYDAHTEHDTTLSNVGHNPLYQYYSNIEIVESPIDGMDGNVLKFTPNTVDVTYNCHGIYTLRADSWSSYWYAPGFKEDHYYKVSFDYATVGTSVGEFAYKTYKTGISYDLLFGGENDNKVHHFEAIIPYSAINSGQGLYLWAFFKDGGGEVYVDNFVVTELERSDVVPENAIFYTDYDAITEHNQTASNIGYNPLYQYYDNVSIVDSPIEGMSGKVLKITPNTVDVTYNCHGYITLRADSWSSHWFAPGFKEDHYYKVSFDYATVGTSVGEFAYKTYKTSISYDLLFGGENDNKVHHFEAIIPYSAINSGQGLYLWAFFKDGGGEVYVDNFVVAELERSDVVPENAIFYTDYDAITEHNQTASNIGHNPLYQYYGNVSIVDSPTEGMSGKVLKITPNTVDVTYNCHGYITLRADSWSSYWYAPGFKEGKNYEVSFDYYTENTSVGEFAYKTYKTSISYDLLLGAENDGTVHHFKETIPYSAINSGQGLYLWAFFKGGGGTVYVDNFCVKEVD